MWLLRLLPPPSDGRVTCGDAPALLPANLRFALIFSRSIASAFQRRISDTDTAVCGAMLLHLATCVVEEPYADDVVEWRPIGEEAMRT
jgi:hypothetical protein